MEILKNRDNIVIASFDKSEQDTFNYFYAEVSQSQINVEITIIDVDKSLLLEVNNFKFTEFNIPEFVKITPLSSGESSGYLELFTENILNQSGYSIGRYNLRYRFYFDILGDKTSTNQLFIRKISSSRKEIVVDYVNKDIILQYNNFSKKYFNRYARYFTFNKFLNFSNLDRPLILNAKNQKNDIENSLILKLYEPLPPQYAVKDVFWIVQLLTDEIEDNIFIDSTDIDASVFETANILKAPNYLNIDYINRDYTTYKNYNSLIDTSSLGDKYFSSLLTDNYIKGIDLNVKYNYFENFVHFGSALQTLNNFRNKLLTIEYHDSKITSSVFSAYESSSLYHKNKKREIIGQFTPYENFLYFESSSYFTSSLYVDSYGTASLIDATFPKYTSSLIYDIYEVTSSFADNWYTTMSAVAFDYDFNNRDALINTLPGYIRQDLIDKQDNEDYITFVNMIGEFFDNIWVYILAIQRMLKRENKFEDGVPSDLIWNILRNYGLNLNDGQNLVDLSRYNYGYYISASTDIIQLERAEKNVTQEIWNRILNNYPYIFKSKGTEKSIRSLFNCYGLPSSLIQIKEFGGPYTTSSFGGPLKKYSFDYSDFTFVLEMTGSEYIETPWTASSYDSMKPDSIEFKFRSPQSAGNVDIFSLSGSDGEIKLELQQHYDEYSRLVLSINSPDDGIISVSSSVRAFNNNEFYSVLVKRSIESDSTSTLQNYYLKVQNHDDYINEIILDDEYILSLSDEQSASNAAYINADALYLGGSPNSTQKFVGAFDEFRLWAEPLTDRTFDFHTKYAAATNGNTLTSSLDTLSFRLSFNDAYDLGATSSMLSDAFLTASYVAYATASGFYTSSIYPYNFSDYERSNTVEQSFIAADMDNKKIRIERNRIAEYIDTGSLRVYPLKGNYSISDYKPQGEVGDFDDAPPDLDTLLIGFTPVDFINKDIIAFYGNNDILTVYGDFNNLYEDYYPKNNELISTYWNYTKNPISFESYINYIATYNKSLFDTVIELVPAKATLIMGTVYDQNILRRNRVRLLYPEEGVGYKQHLIYLDTDLDFVNASANNDYFEAGILNINTEFNIAEDELQQLYGIIDSPIKFSIQEMDLFDYATIIYTFNPYDLINFNNLYVNRQRYNIDKYRNFAGNTKNTSLTTYDRGPVVVITKSSANKLVVNYADIPKLIVRTQKI